ncbi:MAG TPA: divergent PAP2 family protein [Candidatus Nanoarchaeia archaeon]|nr:divergent PAP2 family protein [Candidatus Nanoarchaeia archaeon]
MILLDLLKNKIVLICLFTWFVCQLIKFTLHAIGKRKADYGYFYRMVGGEMPSSHAAVMGAFSTLVYLDQGVSMLFLFAGLMTAIVSYDAIAFRRPIGHHAVILNTLSRPKVKLEHRIGHEPTEVIVGLILGIALALILS